MDFKSVLKEFENLNSMHLNEELWKRDNRYISIQYRFSLVNKCNEALEFIKNNLEHSKP